jgi:hypothetical protein
MSRTDIRVYSYAFNRRIIADLCEGDKNWQERLDKH